MEPPRPSSEVPAEAKLALDVLRAIASARDFDGAVRAMLETLCERAGWTVGEAWLPDASRVVLERSPVSYVRRDASVAVREFMSASSHVALPRGAGLPGRVWASGRPEWIEDVSTASEDAYRRARIALKAGLRSAVSIPVRAEDEVVAVLVFYTALALPPDGERGEILSVMAAQLGDVLRRRRAEELVARQAREILALSTPVLRVCPHVLLAPVLGTMDDARVDQLTERMLHAAVDQKARVVLVDVTGVVASDRRVARLLVDAVASLRLIGSRVVVTGISPALAVLLADTKIEGAITAATLADGLTEAMRAVNR